MRPPAQGPRPRGRKRHGPGPHCGGRRPAEGDEGAGHQCEQDVPRTMREPRREKRRPQQRRDEGEVRARDRDQMCRPAGGEVVLQRAPCEARLRAADDPRHEATLLRRGGRYAPHHLRAHPGERPERPGRPWGVPDAHDARRPHDALHAHARRPLAIVPSREAPNPMHDLPCRDLLRQLEPHHGRGLPRAGGLRLASPAVVVLGRVREGAEPPRGDRDGPERLCRGRLAGKEHERGEGAGSCGGKRRGDEGRHLAACPVRDERQHGERGQGPAGDRQASRGLPCGKRRPLGQDRRDEGMERHRDEGPLGRGRGILIHRCGPPSWRTSSRRCRSHA
jgi:hypothetical protein